ncbi:MAG: CidA/LrgA family protein [Bhargavaea sp.]
MKKIVQLALIFLFYYFGVQVKAWLSLPIPGSIIGLLLLLGFIIVFKNLAVNTHADGASILIRNFTLFFIPTTVAIILYLDLFRTWNAVSFVTVLLSTLLTIALTAWAIERSVGKGEPR